MAPTHYLIQCWLIICKILLNTIQCIFGIQAFAISCRNVYGHSITVQCRYNRVNINERHPIWLFFRVNSASDWYFASVPAMICAISCVILDHIITALDCITIEVSFPMSHYVRYRWLIPRLQYLHCFGDTAAIDILYCCMNEQQLLKPNHDDDLVFCFLLYLDIFNKCALGIYIGATIVLPFMNIPKYVPSADCHCNSGQPFVLGNITSAGLGCICDMSTALVVVINIVWDQAIDVYCCLGK